MSILPIDLSVPVAVRLLLTAVAALAVTAVSGNEVRLTGPQIRAAITGKYVTDEHHWGHKYFADGHVDRSENGRRRAATSDQLQYRDDHSVAYRGLIRPMPKDK